MLSVDAKELIFNYATKYYFEHDTLYSPRNFQLSETEFQQFLVWLEDQSFDYQTPLEIKLDQALEIAKTAARGEQVYQVSRNLIHFFKLKKRMI